jgi:hypothetical protein
MKDIPNGGFIMFRFRSVAIMLVIPGVVSLAALSGCGGTPTTKATTTTTKKGGETKDPTELASTGWGTLAGTVTLEGTVPDPKVIIPDNHNDTKKCLDGAAEWEKVDPSWRVNAKGGVANVVIYLKPPENTFFKIRDEDKKRSDTVFLKQPHCAFDPHVLVLYPSYYDKETKEQKESGQQFKVENNAAFVHNTKFLDKNWTIPPGKVFPEEGKKKPKFEPSYDSYVTFACDVHAWMRAYGWAFDHPYAATTDKDGNFKIENVPTGVKLEVHGWHKEGTVVFNGGKTGSVEMQLDKDTKLEV